ncbi:hypothetical protein AB0M20_03740 [Actinoplanes sp. NPDC051633]|uniref:hypothetical protein n=1 Tax=Actinoplanes sp. NPDC051633 TaxID=3155670 RepID=UPI003444F169
MGRLRWAVPLAVPLAGVLMLAACADDEAAPADVPASVPVESTPAATPEITATTTAAAKPARTAATERAGQGGGMAAFVAAVQAKMPEIAVDRRDEEIEEIAQQACASLAAGTKTDALVAETRALGTADAEATDQATARELIKLAIDTVCPAESDRVDDF